MRKRVLGGGVLMALVPLCIWLLRDDGSYVAASSKSRVGVKELSSFVGGIKARLIFVEGGFFWMGDYGVKYGAEGLPLDSERHSKPLHGVYLSDYYIDKYKITNEDFALFLRYHGYTLRADVPPGMFPLFSTVPRLPAHLDWFEAKAYCSWLADISGLPFSMATEAQWEYASRSRGQFLKVATDDGTYRYNTLADKGVVGVNISSSWIREKFASEMGWNTGSLTSLPVDYYPPNPLGVYSMSDNGLEWVKDWYDADYYKTSPEKDPQGPDHPVHQDSLGRPTKVMRGQAQANELWAAGVNVHRKAVNPYGYGTTHSKVAILSDKTARCVVNGSKI